MTADTIIDNDTSVDLELLEDFFQNAPVGFVMTEADGVPATYNRAFAVLAQLPWPERVPVPAFRPQPMPTIPADGTPVTDIPIIIPGSTRRLLANALTRPDGRTLWVIRPDLRHAIPSVDEDPTEYLRPTPELIAENDALAWAEELGAATDVRPIIRAFSPEQAERRQRELDEFITNAPAAIHLVDVRGNVMYANAIDLAVAGFADEPELFVGGAVRGAYAEPAVLEDLLGRWDSGLATLNFRARLVNRAGAVLPVVIFSNSRFDDGGFRNTRDVVFVDPELNTPPTRTRRFTWPQD
ncbi:MAG: hypothetical protein JOZ47_08110 [Kutzneria sp.]|nr:hypothetical protein [Kutzneria sp.]MBV9845018.1 hypothetical protein [Kutzneria sp.]